MASRSATELAGKLHRYAQLVPDANRDTVGNVALMAKGHFETGIASAGGKPGSEIQGAKGGRRLGASYDIKGGRNPTALIRYRGPVHLLFGNTAPHMIIASRLGFRSTASRLTSRIGANAAFRGHRRHHPLRRWSRRPWPQRQGTQAGTHHTPWATRLRVPPRHHRTQHVASHPPVRCRRRAPCLRRLTPIRHPPRRPRPLNH